MKIELRELTLKNFMMYHEKTVEFKEITKISGKNARGKSTILTAYTWLLFNCDYWLKDNPKVRREIDGISVDDVDVSVEGILDFGGKEISVKKVQKRKFGKDGVSYSDDNTYFINEVPKTLRDFNNYFELDMTFFRACSNINAFLMQKTKEMRAFLFAIADDITDLNIAKKFDDLNPLEVLLEQYSLEEIVTMNKASKAKIAKELPVLEGRIKEKEQDCAVSIDISDLELKRDNFKRRIIESEEKINDSEKVYEDFSKKSDKITALKIELQNIFQKANDELIQKKSLIRKRMDDGTAGFDISRRKVRDCGADIARIENTISANKEYMGKKAEEYKSIYAEEFDESDSLCPTCGQELPADKIEKIKLEFEEKKQKRLGNIAVEGNSLKEGILGSEIALRQLKLQLGEAKDDSVRCNKEKSAAMKELSDLPEKVDLSDNQKYKAMDLQLKNMEDELCQMDSGADYRSQLKIRLTGLREELSVIEQDITKADTSEAKKRLAELREKRLDLEQSKADCEKILFLTDELDRHKNELLTDSINEKFSHVTWKLFEHAKSGGYKSTCIPTMENQSILEMANKGNKILGKLDICNSIQKILDINCPVFLDDAESLDSKNTAKTLKMMDCQVVLLKVTDDAELKIE